MRTIDKIMQAKEKPANRLVKYLPNWLTPNVLTLWRILFLLPILFFVLAEHFIWVLVFFILGALLDYFDGPLARSRGQVSEFGKLFDPTADKIFFVIVIFLVGWTRLPHWLLWITFGLEAFLIFTALIFKPILAQLNLERKAGANFFGKTKMFLQSIGMIVLLISPNNAVFVLICKIILIIALPFSFGSILGHLLGKPVRND